ncbi:Meckelin [Eumeta japonica]|uniref:Meckelin n=1 Tax=Eumeta variegata TaxID=151549 RepID=A0A4C1XZE8_EUMVA|nr:Meckelin [Eumeta japonica]
MREVQCMKCARGYKAVGERCERCVHCTCQRNETLVKDVCMSKEFINNRPKPESGRFHPNAVVEIVRNEYMCLKGDVRACRNLTDKCVKSLYSSDQGGPCRLWIQNKPPPGLVQLAFDPMKSGQSGFSEQISLAKGQYPSEQELRLKERPFVMKREGIRSESTWAESWKHVLLVLTVHTPGGGIKFLRNIDNKSKCLLPMAVHVGNYYTSECSIPIDYLLKFSGESLAAYADMDGSLRPLPITIRTPSGRSVQKGNWATNQFNRYYLIDRFLNPSNNLSSIIYLRTLIVHVRIKRDVANDGLRIKISLEAHYASHSDREKTVTTSLRIENDLPQAGILRALEIWGSVLSAVAVLYAALVWRGTARRGGSQLAIGPLLAGYLADGLLVAAWCTTLHALAAEATNTGFPLPLSKTEETTIEAFVYSAISLKIIYVLWFNWCQSRIDVFLLDWSEYNTTARDVEVFEAKGQGGAVWILREFAALQATRRASPAYTVPLTLLILRLSLDVQDSLPDSPAYFWAFCVSVWLCAHLSILTLNWMKDKALGVPVLKLLTACRESGTSLIAFKEEFYAHYIHGRNDVISDTRSFTGPLATGRVLCVPQISQSVAEGLVIESENTGADLYRRIWVFNLIKFKPLRDLESTLSHRLRTLSLAITVVGNPRHELRRKRRTQ